MPRRPHIEMVALQARVPRGQDGFWAIIRNLDVEKSALGGVNGWTVAEIDARSNVDRGTIRDFVARLLKAGIATFVGEEFDPAGQSCGRQYRLTRHQIDAPRLRRDGTELPEPQTQTIWRTLRMMKSGTAEEIASHATTADRAPDLQVVRRYLRELVAAGVLIPAVEGGGKGNRSVYRLVRDLGPKAPKILRAHVVYDPNTDAVIGVPVLTETQS